MAGMLRIGDFRWITPDTHAAVPSTNIIFLIDAKLLHATAGSRLLRAELTAV